MSSGQYATAPPDKTKVLSETINKIVTDNKIDSESSTEFQVMICGVVIKQEKSTIKRNRVLPLNWELICISMIMTAENEITN